MTISTTFIHVFVCSFSHSYIYIYMRAHNFVFYQPGIPMLIHYALKCSIRLIRLACLSVNVDELL